MNFPHPSRVSLVHGFVRCFVGVLICGITLWLKSQTEEHFMLERFGEQYENYRKKTRALVRLSYDDSGLASSPRPQLRRFGAFAGKFLGGLARNGRLHKIHPDG